MRRSRCITMVLLLTAGCRVPPPDLEPATTDGSSSGDDAESELEPDGAAESASGAAGGEAEGPSGPASTCGNERLEGIEECDGDELRDEVCSSLGFEGGDLACNDDCTFDTSACNTCGNGMLEPDEECDSDGSGQFLFQSDVNCASLGFSGGVLLCIGCTPDTSFCSICGNGSIEPGEACDGEDLAGEDCSSQSMGKFMGGQLACTPNCSTFDFGGCW